jgi:hypothetical protein
MTPIIRFTVFTLSLYLLSGCNMGGNEGRNLDSLIQRLAGANTAQKDSIFQVLDRSMLLQKDLPTIYAGIQQTYPDDSLRERGSKAMLIGLLETVNDESTPAFLKEQFMLWDTDYFLKRKALFTLATINTEASLETFIELLQLEARNMAPYAETFFTPIVKDPTHSEALFPAALALAENRNYTFSILETLKVGLEEGFIQPESIKEDLLPIREVFRAQRKQRDRYSPGSRSYLNANALMASSMKCLSYFPTESSSQQVLDLASQDEDIEMRLFALIIRLRGDTTGTHQILHEMASDFRYRNRMYEVLNDRDLGKYFPPEYYTQEAFAEGDLASWLKMPTHRAAFPESISLIKRFAFQPGEDQAESNFYLFKFTYGKGWQIGLSGPQPLDTTEVSIVGFLTGSKYLSEEARTEEEHVEALLEE